MISRRRRRGAGKQEEAGESACEIYEEERINVYGRVGIQSSNT